MEQRYKMYLDKKQFNSLAHFLKTNKEFALYDKIMKYATPTYMSDEIKVCIGFFPEELRKMAFMLCDILPEDASHEYFNECVQSSLEWQKSRTESRKIENAVQKDDNQQTLF